MVFIAGFSGMAQKGPHRGDRGAMNDLTAEQVATLQTKKMTLALDLNASQQKAVQELHLENVKLRKEKMEAIRAEKATDEGGKPSPEKRFAMQNERLDHMISTKGKMKQILSPEQYEKWQKAHHHKRQHRGHRENSRKR